MSADAERNRLHAEDETLLAEAVARRSARLCQEAGGRIGTVVGTIVEAWHPTDAALFEGIRHAVAEVGNIVRVRGAAEGLHPELVADLEQATIDALWRRLVPALVAKIAETPL